MITRLILFDLEGTLIDGAAAHERALDEVHTVLRHFRPALTKEALERHFAGSLRMQVRGRTGAPVSQQAIYAERFKRTLTWLGEEDDNLARRLGRLYASLVLDRAVAYPDATEAVPSLARRAALSVVANCTAAEAERQLAASGLARWTFAVFTPDEGLAAKPAPDLLYRALEAAETSPADAIMVGDSAEADVAAAHAAGVPAVWVNRAGRTWPEGITAPDQTIRALMELL